MQELKEYHITANGYDMKTGKYTIPECYVKASGYIAAAEVLSEYLATGANADQVRLVERVKLTKAELNKFIQWTSSRYNSYLGFGKKADAVQRAYIALISQAEGILVLECAGGVGESYTRTWATKQGTGVYTIDCKNKSITEGNSGRTIYFKVPEPYVSALDEQQRNFVLHAAGVSYGNAEGIKYLKKNKEPYRGFYAVNPENYERYAELKKLAELGYFNEGPGPTEAYIYFHLTPKGVAEAAALVYIKL